MSVSCKDVLPRTRVCVLQNQISTGGIMKRSRHGSHIIYSIIVCSYVILLVCNLPVFLSADYYMEYPGLYGVQYKIYLYLYNNIVSDKASLQCYEYT